MHYSNIIVQAQKWYIVLHLINTQYIQVFKSIDQKGMTKKTKRQLLITAGMFR